MTWPWQAVNPSSILPPKRWTAKGLAQLWLLQMALAPEMPCSQILYNLFAGAVQMLDCSPCVLQAKQGDGKSVECRKTMPKSLISISLIVCNVPKCSGGILELQALVDWGLLSITSFLNAKREAVLWTASVTTASRTHTQSPKTWSRSLPLQIWSTCSTGFHINPKFFEVKRFQLCKTSKALCKTWKLWKPRKFPKCAVNLSGISC